MSFVGAKRSLLDGRPRWAHPKAVWAADFNADRYGIGGVTRPLGALLVATRSSPHYLAGPDGIFQSFAQNTLARIDGIGAYIGGQATSLLANGNDASLADWSLFSATRASLGTTVLGILKPTRVISGGATSDVIVSSSWTATNGQPVAIQIYHRAGTSGRIRVYGQNVTDNINSLLFGPSAAPTVSSTSAGAITGLSNVLLPDGVTYRLAFVWTPNFSGSARLRIGPDSAASGEDMILCGADAFTGSFQRPFHSTSTPAPTRLATDLRAASFGWFGANGLATGFTVLAVVNLTHLGDGVSRGIWSFGPNIASTRIMGYINTTDAVQFAVQQNNTTLLAKWTPNSFTTLGRKRVAITIKSGAFHIAATGLTPVSDATVLSLPVPTDLMLGDISASTSYLNDTIEQLQICRPLSQAEALAWAAAA